jgi:hypothetical protein
MARWSRHFIRKERKHLMKPSKNSVVLTAALAGLLGGTISRVNAAPQDKGQASQPEAKPNPKHSCAGKNACKGTGGCATDGSKKNKAAEAGVAEKHSCKGKNTCKGNGGCATDGSLKKKKAA